MSTPIFPLEVWTSQITQASIPANNNALKVEVLNSPAINFANNPPTNNENDIYIVGSSPSGAFSSFTPNNVAIFKGGTWLEFERFDGWIKTINFDAYIYSANSNSWNIFAVGPQSEPWSYLVLQNDETNDNATFTDTSLSFSADADSLYKIELFAVCQTTATTNGVGIRPSAPANSEGLGFINQFTATNNTTYAGFQYRDLDSDGATTAMSAVDTNLPITGEFLVKTNGTAGDIVIQLRSEVNGQTSTMVSGLTHIRYRKIN